MGTTSREVRPELREVALEPRALLGDVRPFREEHDLLRKPIRIGQWGAQQGRDALVHPSPVGLRHVRRPGLHDPKRCLDLAGAHRKTPGQVLSLFFPHRFDLIQGLTQQSYDECLRLRQVHLRALQADEVPQPYQCLDGQFTAETQFPLKLPESRDVLLDGPPVDAERPRQLAVQLFRDLDVEATSVHPFADLAMQHMLEGRQGPGEFDPDIGKPVVKGLDFDGVQVSGCGTLGPAVPGHTLEHWDPTTPGHPAKAADAVSRILANATDPLEEISRRNP